MITVSKQSTWASELEELERIATSMGEKLIDPLPASRIDAMAREMLKHDDVKRVAEQCVTSNSNLEPLFLALKPRAEQTFSSTECKHLVSVTVAVAKLVIEEHKGMTTKQ